MTKSVVFILVMLLLVSCSPFSRMKYGHIRKVPATPVEYSSSCCKIESCAQKSSVDTTKTSAAPLMDSAYNETVRQDSVLPASASDVRITQELKAVLLRQTLVQSPLQLKTELPLRLQPRSDLPPNLQLFFAIVFICLALLFLLMCIFVIPYMPGGWLWILFWEIILLYSVWKLIATAVAFLRGKYGRAKSYEEH